MMTKQRRYILLSMSAFVLFWAYLLFFPVVYDKAGAVYYLKPGTSKSTVISELSQQHLLRMPILFSVYTFTYLGGPLKSGEYLFPAYSTPVSIWRQLNSGTGLYYRRFTIIPGKTFLQIRQALANAEGITGLTASFTDAQIMYALGQPTLAPEGEFFPETYYYTRGTQDLVILKRAYDLMQNQLEDAWQRRAANLPYRDKYQALIAASLVEKEAYLNSERPLIAGVLVNRLRKNMLLQFDPTVIYGLGARYDGKIYKKDLKENTPYNTYMHTGLPPTPIAMPGMASINAALQPAQHDFLYFVAKGDGSHQFTSTLADHYKAVNAASQMKLLKKSS